MRWVRVAGALALAGMLGALAVEPATPSQEPRELRPDLRARAPFQVEIVRARADGRTRYLLAFESITENVGDGALHVLARRRDRDDPTMTAAQLIDRSDGSAARVPKVGTLRYSREADHSHWHYLRFMTYELRGARDNELIAPDQKTGFCLGDRHPVSDESATEPLYTGECGKGRRGLLRMREGISVGWYDNYSPLLEGQYVDVTGVVDGRYVLVHRANHDRKLRETRYSNNSSSSLIALRTPKGSRRPEVRIVKRCPYRARCG